MAAIVTDDGVTLHAEEAGQGEPLLFIHEFAGDHRSWEPQLRFFSAAYRCVTYGARGYPPSGVPTDPAAYSQARAVGDAIAVLDGLGIDRAHVVGLSMGGFGALSLAMLYPATFGTAGAHSPSLWTLPGPDFFGDAGFFAVHDPSELLHTQPQLARGLKLWLDVGGQDPLEGARSEALHAQLVADGVPLAWHEWPGDHSGTYWGGHMADYLRFYDAALELWPRADPERPELRLRAADAHWLVHAGGSEAERVAEARAGFVEHIRRLAEREADEVPSELAAREERRTRHARYAHFAHEPIGERDVVCKTEWSNVAEHVVRALGSVGTEARGIEDTLTNGVLAGYPVVDVKVALVDGSYHEVDSNEQAFHIAGSMAVKDAVKKASAVLLEPIMKVEVSMPEEFMGDVMGDLSARRGHILGMEGKGSTQIVRAHVPLASMFGYATELRSMTQGRASYSMEFDHYQEVPKSVAEEIIAKARA